MKTSLNQDLHESLPELLPVIPTLDVVVFPHMIVPLMVLDETIIKGINASVQESKLVLLLAAKKQRNQNEAIGTKDLHSVGTIASVMRLIKIPEGGIKILVQGLSKARVANLIAEDEMLHASVEAIPDVSTELQGDMITAHINNIKSLSEKLSGTHGSFSPDFHTIISKMNDADKIADFVLSHLNLSVDQAQTLLETNDQEALLASLYTHLYKEIEVAEIQEKIRNHARESMNKAQKEFYLREQIRAIKKELGEDDGEEIDLMRTQLANLQVAAEIRTEIERHLSRLEKTSPDSMEAAVIRNHLEWIFALPWNTQTDEILDINYAQEVLDKDHYGLHSIKDRILDFISIRHLKQDGYAPILCLVGPPGVGKTSLGQSIAKSLGRMYARISLGGVKDEAEIRGHRRTYVGAMPGRFIQAMRKAGSNNPLIVIDELDKIGSDFRGDPSAAMLEVLDPHQNKTFYDNYLGLPYNLSKAMFVATANTLDSISEPLRDRMEIIELSGYSLEEKFHITKHHIINRALCDTGLENHNVTMSDMVIKDIIGNYTKEAGVRQCERLVRKLCSKAARSFVENKTIVDFTPDNITSYLGPRKFLEDDFVIDDQVGITNGLAWTPFGGEMLKIEAVLMPGKGKLILTGQLGNVMKESAQAALSYCRAHAKEFNISERAFTHHDLHIHVPAGAVPKDGPSAGITMLTSILSSLTKRPINAQYAMTGELNLRGEVMPIGGVKEKILAAKRNKVSHIILPMKNKNDLIGIDNDLIKDINLIFVSHAQEVIDQVLMPVM